MLKIFLKMLDIEKDMTFSERAKGKWVMRPSSIVVIVVALLYLLSPIDIIPEGLLTGIAKLYGYIDDITVLILTGYIVYLDIGGEFNGSDRIPNGKVQKRRKHSGQSSVSSENKSVPTNDDDADTSDGVLLNVRTKQGFSSNIRSSANSTIHSSDYDNDIGNSYETDSIGEEELSISEEESKFVL